MKRLFCTITLLLLTIGPSHADTLGIDISSPFGGASQLGYEGSLGWEFSVSTTITITALGSYDYGGYGWGGTPPPQQQVGLWDAAGDPLASAYVSRGTIVGSSWYFQSLTTPITLSPGTYIVASQGGAGYVYDPKGVTLASGITFDGSMYGAISPPSYNNAPLVFPTSPGYLGYGYFGGNFEFTAGGVPVPSPPSLLLLGSGLLGLARDRLRGRWRK